MTWRLECNDKSFQNKLEAIRENTVSKRPIRYRTPDSYYSHDFTMKTKQSLEELCATHAKTLRSQYDDIHLFYSGGSDSHYILQTFLDNKIKLDKVIMVKSGYKSADFEIDDYALPFIKSTGLDFEVRQPSQDYYRRYYLETPLDSRTQNEYWHHYRLNNHFENVYNTPEGQLNLFGKEKPRLCHVDGKWYTYFLDISTTTQPGQYNFFMEDPEIYAKQCHMLVDSTEKHKDQSEYNLVTHYNEHQYFWNVGIGRYRYGDKFPLKDLDASGYHNNKDKLALQSADPELVIAWKRRNRKLIEQYGPQWFNQNDPALGTVGVFSDFFGLTEKEIKTVDDLYPNGFKIK